MKTKEWNGKQTNRNIIAYHVYQLKAMEIYLQIIIQNIGYLIFATYTYTYTFYLKFTMLTLIYLNENQTNIFP